MWGGCCLYFQEPQINQPSPQLNAWQTHCVGSDLLSLRVISSTEGLVVEQGPLAPAIPGPDLSQHNFLFFIEFIGVTLVDKMIQVLVHNFTSSVHFIVHLLP